MMRRYIRAAGRAFQIILLSRPIVAAATTTLQYGTIIGDCFGDDCPRPYGYTWMFWTNMIFLTGFACILMVCYGGALFLWMKARGLINTGIQRIFFWFGYILLISFLYIGLPFYIISSEAIYLLPALIFGPGALTLIGLVIGRIKSKSKSNAARLAIIGVVSNAILLGLYSLIVYLISIGTTRYGETF